MPNYRYEVDVMERWARIFVIESDKPLTREELQDKANEASAGNDDVGKEIDFEYADTNEPDTWTIKELTDDGRLKRMM